jgi:hypothetical protein
MNVFSMCFSLTSATVPPDLLIFQLYTFLFVDGPSNTSNQDINYMEEAMPRASWHLLVQMYDSGFLSRPLLLGSEFVLSLVGLHNIG